MRPLLLILTVGGSLAWTSAAGAKPRPNCEADLAVVVRAIEHHELHPLPAYPYLFSMSFQTPDARSRKAARILEYVAQKNLSVAAFMDSDYGRFTTADVVRSRDEFTKDKRILAKFTEVRFLVIDTFESFVDAIGPDDRASNLRQLRKLLSDRLRAGRPTLLLSNDVGVFDLYLRKLPDDPKSDANADKT